MFAVFWFVPLHVHVLLNHHLHVGVDPPDEPLNFEKYRLPMAFYTIHSFIWCHLYCSMVADIPTISCFLGFLTPLLKLLG